MAALAESDPEAAVWAAALLLTLVRRAIYGIE
jgi:hypothetical protein